MRNEFTLMVVLDTIIKLLGFFPCILDTGFLLGLNIFVFLVDEVVMILTFLDNFAEMILLIFDRFG